MKPEPKRIRLGSLDEAPSLDAIVKIAQGNEWTVFELPAVVHVLPDKSRTDETKTRRRSLCDALAPLLPTHRVWDNFILALPAARQNQPGSVLHGTASIHLRRVVSREEIAPYLPQLEAAAHEYRCLANFLAPKLAEALGVELSMLAAKPYILDYAKQQRGQVETELGFWSYYLHGIDSCFGSATTGQVVEARMGCGMDFGVLDSGFFLRFLETTKKYQETHRILGGYFVNMELALSMLAERGILRHDTAPITRGWRFIEPQEEPVF